MSYQGNLKSESNLLSKMKVVTIFFKKTYTYLIINLHKSPKFVQMLLDNRNRHHLGILLRG